MKKIPMKISIITVVYNGVDHIRTAIESVVSQKYENIEYIIIDGGSIDGTVDIVKEYKNRVSVFISESDRGIYDAMNKGISLASGDVIGILNSDDFYVDEMVIEKVVKVFRDEKDDSMFADLVFVRSDNLKKTVRYYDNSKFNPSMFAYGLMPSHPSFFVKLEIYEKYGLYRTDLKVASDYDILARFLYKHRISYYYLNEVIVKMRIGGASTSLFNILFTNSKEIIKACRNNGIDTNWFKIISRYFGKIDGLLRK